MTPRPMKAPRQPTISAEASASVTGPSRSPTDDQVFILASAAGRSSPARSTRATSAPCTKASLAAPQTKAAATITQMEWESPNTIIDAA